MLVGGAIGRYRILEPLGEGGLGIVYLAHDPKLDRRVALKLVRPNRGGAVARARMVREAQALARLSHPNVVSVFDVGTHNDAVFIVMEFIDGIELGTWARGRKPAAIARAFIQAARGLDAAHREGLVHRDFKPGNVLVDKRGRIRVLDFGLARAPGRGAMAVTADDAVDGLEGTLLEEPLTETGTVMGTPAYMAPEQYLGKTADARADQYSFCVALHEALYGRRPFEGASLQALRLAVLRSDVVEPEHGDVPRSVWPVIARGLSRDPTARFDDMLALQRALARTRRRRLLPFAAAGGVAALLFASVAMQADAPPPCGVASADYVWSSGRRRVVRIGLVEEVPETADLLFGQVDAAFARWAAAHDDVRTDVCADLGAHFDARAACLAAQRATALGLARAAGENAAAVIDTLPDPHACRNAGKDLDGPPPDQGAEVARILEAGGKLSPLVLRGAHDKAVVLADQLIADARRSGYAPLTAQLTLARARVLADKGRLDDAVAGFEDALWLAEESGAKDVAAQSVAALIKTHASDRMDLTAARRWSRPAQRLLEEHPGPTRSRISLLTSLGHLSKDADIDVARRRFREAADLAEGQGDNEHAAIALVALANAVSRQGHAEEALEFFREALRLRGGNDGVLRPTVVAPLFGLASTYSDLKRFEESEEMFARAEEVMTTFYGPEDPRLGRLYVARGIMLSDSGRPEESRRSYEQALPLLVKVHGPDSVVVAHALTGLGVIEYEANDFAGALQTYNRALAIYETSLGADHPSTALVQANMGELALDQGDTARGRALLEAALEVFESHFGLDHPHTIWVADLLAERG